MSKTPVALIMWRCMQSNTYTHLGSERGREREEEKSAWKHCKRLVSWLITIILTKYDAFDLVCTLQITVEPKDNSKEIEKKTERNEMERKRKH